MGSFTDVLLSIISYVETLWTYIKGFFGLISSYTSLSETVFSWLPESTIYAILFFLSFGFMVGIVRIISKLRELILG